MPIGWTRDLVGGTHRAAATTRNASLRWSVLDRVANVAVTIVQDVIEITHRVVEAQVWTRWETAADEKVCPICGPYTGRVWRADDGPHPPLHPNCRCRRVVAFTTWTVRE